MEILYFIPARGGSKGLPGKNIRLLNGKPMIAWSIEAALNSKHKRKVIVSTDSDEIAEIAKVNHAEVPFLRPSELSTDTATTMDVIFHCLNWFESKGEIFDYVVLLQPTSPLRTEKHIDEAFMLLKEKKASAVVSVCKNEHHPMWSNAIPADGNMKNFIRPEVKGKNRQQLETSFRLNGAIYIATPEYLKAEQSFIGKDTYAYEMTAESSIDIDTEIDFLLAEMIMKK